MVAMNLIESFWMPSVVVEIVSVYQGLVVEKKKYWTELETMDL